MLSTVKLEKNLYRGTKGKKVHIQLTQMKSVMEK